MPAAWPHRRGSTRRLAPHSRRTVSSRLKHAGGATMSDTSGMLPNWLSEAGGDKDNPKEIAQSILRAPEFVQLITEATNEAKQIMHAQRSKIGPAGGYPSYNHEVARAIVTRLVQLYPEVCLSNPRTRPS